MKKLTILFLFLFVLTATVSPVAYAMESDVAEPRPAVAKGQGQWPAALTSDVSGDAQADTGDSSNTLVLSADKVSAIELNHENVTLPVGSTVTLLAEVSSQNSEITWVSNNTKVALVDQDGKVTALKVGEAIITAICGDESARCVVSVTEKTDSSDAYSISIDQTDVTLDLDGEKNILLTATVTPKDSAVIWTSSDDTVATVNATTGFVSAKKPGTAVITATANSMDAQVRIKVLGSDTDSSEPEEPTEPVEPEPDKPTGSLLLDTKSYTMPIDGIYDIKMTLTGASTSTLRVYSSRPSIATVQALGSGKYRVTGLKNGQTYIVFEVLKNGKAVTHASVKVRVSDGVRPHGVSNRSASLFYK